MKHLLLIAYLAFIAGVVAYLFVTIWRGYAPDDLDAGQE